MPHQPLPPPRALRYSFGVDREGWSRVRSRWPWLALLALSLLLHLWGLGGRSFHHDESIHAHSAYDLATHGIYRYDPTYHGPLLYYLTAGTFLVAGDSDFTARLPIAVAGVLLLGVAWSLRRPLGEGAAWWTGLLATLSPTMLFYGRFLRMDILELLCASAAAVAAWRAAHGSSRAWVWFGIWTALAFATKENAYVTAALVVATWAVMVLLEGVRRALPATVRFLVANRWGILTAAATAVVVVVPLFTVFFAHPEDWFFPGRAITYWWGQHEMGRVAGPWWFHLPRLAIYEFLTVGAALVWVVRHHRRLRLMDRALFVFAVLSVAMYAYLREKVPWLTVHQVWAFLPLAGAQLADTFSPRGRWWGRTAAGFGLAATVACTITASFILDEVSPNRRRVEALTYVQTCPDLQPVVREGQRLGAEGVDPVAAVSGDGGWPLTWYWRHVPVWWDIPRPGLRPPLVVCNPEQEAEVRRRLGPGYVSERLPLRAWWLMENSSPSITDVLRYVFLRLPWGIIGSTDVIVLHATGEESPGAQPAAVPAAISSALPVKAARVFGQGWLGEPRGLAVRADGVVAVADSGLSTVHLFAPDGKPLDAKVPPDLSQPEAVAWTPEGLLVIADTWNHRLRLLDVDSGVVRDLPAPPGGWYGPRGVAVATDGTIAATDTGNKRIVLIQSRGAAAQARVISGPGQGPGQLVEPGGITWLDPDSLLVCDTGNHRLQELDRDGAARRVVPLPGAWTDFYARPQVTVVAPGLWLASDTSGKALLVVRRGVVSRIDLGGSGITPTGVARQGSSLYVADLAGRVWVFDLALNS